jgi:hypothetical protein
MDGRRGFSNRLFARGMRVDRGRSDDDHRIGVCTSGYCARRNTSRPRALYAGDGAWNQRQRALVIVL